MKLKDLSIDERPREKMMEKGASALSNTELLAILLRTGTGKMNVVELAREVLKNAENKLCKLTLMSLEQLCKINGIGPSKAICIAAAFELGKRYSLEPLTERKYSISNPNAVYILMAPELRTLDHEECWAVFLNRANYVISKERISSGGLDSTVIDVKTILRKALEKKASAMILVHNHPSGNPHPGTNDIRETRNLKKALETCGISLTDHVIIAEGCYYSFADEQKVEII